MNGGARGPARLTPRGQAHRHCERVLVASLSLRSDRYRTTPCPRRVWRLTRTGVTQQSICATSDASKPAPRLERGSPMVQAGLGRSKRASRSRAENGSRPGPRSSSSDAGDNTQDVSALRSDGAFIDPASGPSVSAPAPAHTSVHLRASFNRRSMERSPATSSKTIPNASGRRSLVL